MNIKLHRQWLRESRHNNLIVTFVSELKIDKKEKSETSFTDFLLDAP